MLIDYNKDLMSELLDRERGAGRMEGNTGEDRTDGNRSREAGTQAGKPG